VHIPLLTDILIILTLSVFVTLLFNKLKLPTVLGLLITGIICGPYLLSLVTQISQVEILAEIGVILLLFTIGLEFSITDLLRIKKYVFIGGTIQVVLTILLSAVICYFMDFSLKEDIFIGFLVSLSSTAIVLKLLQESREISSPQGKITLGILIFQDLAVVLMMLLIPILSGSSENILSDIGILILKGLIIIAGVYVTSHYVMPKLLYQIAKTKSKELFILSIIVICFAVGWATSSLGLSLSLGAFIAGLIISESEYSHEAVGNIIPFKAIFESFFFVSIGMLLDVFFVLQNVYVIIVITLVVMVLKFLTGWFSAFSLKVAVRTMVLVGLLLSQVGEFSFVLAKIGYGSDLISATSYQYFLAVAIITMALTPFIFRSGHRITQSVLNTRLSMRFGDYLAKKNFTDPALIKIKDYKNHIIVIGYGLNGRNVVKAAKYALLPYVIIDTNPDVVKEELANGEPIIFGDALNENILTMAGVLKAKVVVIAISDSVGTRRMVSTIQHINEQAYTIVRTKYVQDINTLIKLGANEVVSEEYETSIEVFTRVLYRYRIPRNDIEQLVGLIRSSGYEMLRTLSTEEKPEMDISSALQNVEIANFKVTEMCPLAYKTIADSDMRNRYGVTLLGVAKKDHIVNVPDGATVLEPEDVIYVLGEPDKIIGFKQLFC
jgi:CPA2 family monovalent cation:H+ antiporter-2